MEIPGMTKEQVDLAFLQHRRGQLRDWAALSLDQKMEMLAEMSDVVEAFDKSRAKRAATARVAEEPPK
jgi:hypothetical protein